MKTLKKARVSRRRFVRLVQTQPAALDKPCESGTLLTVLRKTGLLQKNLKKLKKTLAFCKT